MAGIVVMAGTPCAARSTADDAYLKSLLQNDRSEVAIFNDFRVQEFSKKEEKTVALDQANAIVELATPLNSRISGPGDPVRAVVKSSRLPSGKPWLPEGTELDGVIEEVKNATFAKTDAKLCLRFYTATVNGKTFPINTAPATADKRVHPEKLPVTRKRQIRNVLMAASFIAIPLAIGTGGTSIAISTGAGAIIGGVLADNGKHVQGAVNGAWEGSGLGVLDPIVKKGRTVQLAQGTQLELELREEIHVPVSVIRLAAEQERERESPSVVATDTHAKLISVHTPSEEDCLSQCRRLITQNDLAGALNAAEQALRDHPDSRQLKTLRTTIIQNATQTAEVDSRQPEQMP